ncbi:unnamed protein product [Mycena citricolor]|uniref:Uncharacterized protein n=1 Tax=Mycena citricolor TaxID=2018698 RepID=A0AAD2HRW6_9AGAR|nr:unnamed protein product [Mycena citricolor]
MPHHALFVFFDVTALAIAPLVTTIMSTRSATHAGDWYTADAGRLDKQLTTWLAAVDGSTLGYSLPVRGCKAIIAPCNMLATHTPVPRPLGLTELSMWRTCIKRVVLLGPSHHVYLDGCALSQCSSYATPIGDIPLDTETISALRATGKFSDLTQDADEDEHSLEMHLPYIRKVFQDRDIVLTPVLVGSISMASEASYGALLAPYLERPDTLTVVSSDFCHWGQRFSYTYYRSGESANPIHLSRSLGPASEYPIHASIEALDREAMSILTLPSDEPDCHGVFSAYLSRTKNTICGRHPIGVLLGSMAALKKQGGQEIQWTRYEQSSKCLTVRDSSVSYASAWVKF